MKSRKQYYYVIGSCLLILSMSVSAASETVVNAGLAYKYDDNVFKQDLENIDSNSSLEKSGTVVTKSAGITSNLSWSKITVTGLIGVNQSDYSEQPELDNESYDLSLSMLYALNNKLDFNTSFASSRRLKDFTETDVRQKNEVEISSLNFGFNYKVNSKLSLGSKLDVVTSKNLLNELSALDSKKTILSVNASMQLLPKLLSEVRYANTSSESLSGDNNSLNFNQSVIGVALNYSHSPKTGLALDFSQQELIDKKAFNYSITIDFQATPKSQLNLSIFNKQVDSVNEASLQDKDIGLNFGYSYLYSSKWNYLLNARIIERKADALLSSVVEPYTDNLALVSLTSNYLFSSTLSFSFGYTYQQRDSSRKGFDYKSNIFQINSNLQF